jgi:hypothetical protein
MRTGRSRGATVVLAASTIGCVAACGHQVASSGAPGAVSGSSPTSRSTAQPTDASPRYVVSRVTVATTIDGEMHLAPPAGDRPDISGPQAFAVARRQFGDPKGITTPRVVLTRYTNRSQGVDRLVWAVIDFGGSCQPVGPNRGPSAPPLPAEHPCLSVTFLDAHTGQVVGGYGTGDSRVVDPPVH